MVIVILLLMIPSEESHPKIFSTSPSFIWGSTNVFNQDSNSIQKLSTKGHSMKACNRVSDGSLQYLQLESVAIPISTSFLFVTMRECSSLKSMYLVYAFIGVFLMFFNALSIYSGRISMFSTSDHFVWISPMIHLFVEERVL